MSASIQRLTSQTAVPRATASLLAGLARKEPQQLKVAPEKLRPINSVHAAFKDVLFKVANPGMGDADEEAKSQGRALYKTYKGLKNPQNVPLLDVIKRELTRLSSRPGATKEEIEAAQKLKIAIDLAKLNPAR